MEKENLPEAVQEEKSQVKCIFLRTVLREDVYNRLKDIAQEYSTGQGHWDFGVAIQVLLESYDNTKLTTQSEKLDFVINILTQDKPKEEPKKEEYIELLGGEKIKKESE